MQIFCIAVHGWGKVELPKLSYGRVFSMFEFPNVSLNEFFSKSWVINTPRDNSRSRFWARYVAHFFNCSPLNDETIGETKRDPIVMLCREEWYLFSETESLSKFATSCSQLLSISISKFSNPVSSGQLHLSTCKTILCLKFFYWSHFFKQFYWILNISLTTKILLLTTLFRPRIVISL